MPQVTVYVRDEDLEKWKAIEKKSEFIHDALNGNSGKTIIAKRVPMEKIPKVPEEWTMPPKKFIEEVVDNNKSDKLNIPRIEKIGVNLCKVHGTPLTAYGKCLMKGCKYA